MRHFQFDSVTMMLAYVLSQSYVRGEMANARNDFRPFPPPNSPLLVDHSAPLQVEAEDEEDENENDGIDFQRVREELDRLLDEDPCDSDDDVVDGSQDEDFTSVLYRFNRPRPTIKIYSAGRMSRSL